MAIETNVLIKRKNGRFHSSLQLYRDYIHKTRRLMFGGTALASLLFLWGFGRFLAFHPKSTWMAWICDLEILAGMAPVCLYVLIYQWACGRTKKPKEDQRWLSVYATVFLVVFLGRFWLVGFFTAFPFWLIAALWNVLGNPMACFFLFFFTAAINRREYPHPHDLLKASQLFEGKE